MQLKEKMFPILEKKMFKLQRGHEDETKLTWLTAVALTGEGMTEFGEVKGGGPQAVSPPAPPHSPLWGWGAQSPHLLSQRYIPSSFFVSLEFISEEN